MSGTLTASWSRALALTTAGLLAVLLIWLLARLVWLVVAGPQLSSLPMAPIPLAQAPGAARDGFRWDLFGEAPPSAFVPAPPVVAASGSLRLKGVMAGGPDAFAIIADEQGRERVYRLGAELPDGSTVEGIEALRVILARNGRREALELPRSLGSAGPQTRPGAAARPELPGIRGFEVPISVSAAAFDLPAGATGLADQVSILPVTGGGFRVRPGRDARLFAEIGLQLNDVVMAVNGRPLASEDEARALFTEVLRSGELSITINRQGQDITLRPDLDQILARLAEQ